MVARAETPLETEVHTAPGFDDFELKLGDMMRGERATLGKSLLDVQRELRIRASYIAAIENCDLSAFDVQGFVAGHVRSYARYLGMDPDWCFQRFCKESGFQPAHGMASESGGGRQARRQPADMTEALSNPHALFIPQSESFWAGVEPRALGSLLVLVLLVGGLGYGGWSVLREVQKVNLTPVDAAPAVIAVLDPAQDVSRGTPDAENSELAMNLPQPDALDRIYRPKALDVPVLTRRDTPIAAIDPGLGWADKGPAMDGAAAEEGSTPLNLALPGDQAIIGALALAEGMGSGPQSQPAAESVRTVAPDAPMVELLAARPAWVRVTAPDGSVILEKTMDAGERFALPRLETPPVLRTGNSGAVYFSVNGETYGPSAPGAQVVKGIELSPDALTERFALAEPDKDPELARMIAVASAARAAGPEGEAADDRPQN